MFKCSIPSKRFVTSIPLMPSISTKNFPARTFSVFKKLWPDVGPVNVIVIQVWDSSGNHWRAKQKKSYVTHLGSTSVVGDMGFLKEAQSVKKQPSPWTRGHLTHATPCHIPPRHPSSIFKIATEQSIVTEAYMFAHCKRKTNGRWFTSMLFIVKYVFFNLGVGPHFCHPYWLGIES